MSPAWGGGRMYHQVARPRPQVPQARPPQGVSPKVVVVPCGPPDYWIVYYGGGGESCYAQNGIVSAYPGWWAIAEVQSGNNSGVVYYYSSCDWANDEAGGTVLQHYMASWSIWIHNICMTGFDITGR